MSPLVERYDKMSRDNLDIINKAKNSFVDYSPDEENYKKGKFEEMIKNLD